MNEVTDVVDFMDIVVVVDSESDAAECGTLLDELKRRMKAYIIADLLYHSCLGNVEDGTATLASCDTLLDARDDARAGWGPAGRDGVNAGCE